MIEFFPFYLPLLNWHALAYSFQVHFLDDAIVLMCVGSALQGLLPNYIKVVPSIAIAFVTYEKLKEGLGVELRISS